MTETEYQWRLGRTRRALRGMQKVIFKLAARRRNNRRVQVKKKRACLMRWLTLEECRQSGHRYPHCMPLARYRIDELFAHFRATGAIE